MNWNNIRSIEKSQNNGFEELVCQLAARERISGQKKFTRVGKPDGGKECFWEFEDGSIYCWQAKYFTSTITAIQWTQINKSVTDAINNHKSLKTYYVSIPIDMPDGKQTEKKSLLEKWNEKVNAWKEHAKSIGREINILFWGSHELITRLSKKENEGLSYFWFNEQEFTDDWFDKKNKESIEMLGGRYTPELNFELPVVKLFDGLSRNDSFRGQTDKRYAAVLEKFRRLHLNNKNDEISKGFTLLEEAVEKFKVFYECIEFNGIMPIPFDELIQAGDVIAEHAGKLQQIYYDLRSEIEKAKEGKTDWPNRPYSNEFSELRNLDTSIYEFRNYMQSATCTIANNPFVLLTGEAGIGKSHLLADLVKLRKDEGSISLLLLGENFSTSEMHWTQLLQNQLRKNIDEFVFLGAINAKAESLQKRIILIIDALNEGQGRIVWPKKLKTFINTINEYAWIGLVVSVRDSFEELIAPQSDFDASYINRIRHTGFADLEYEASNHFFEHYKITPPGVPFLDSEFQNPLFLKLFCEGLQKRNMNYVPEGYEGITMIIDFFIESVEIKLSGPDELDYDVKLKPVRNAISKIVNRLIESETDRLTYIEANNIVNAEFEGKCVKRDLYLKRLISEGVLNTDLFWNSKNDYEDGVHFAYQRFQDHLIVHSILEQYLNRDRPADLFTSGPLKKLAASEEGFYYHQNLVEALSIQLPEIIGKELYEVLTEKSNYYSIAEGYIGSLNWRKADTITESSRDYVVNVISRDEGLFHRFIETIISCTSKPNFFFNAEWLHKILFKQKMSKRDLWWTTFLQDKYGEEAGRNSIKRLIDWCWKDEEKKYLAAESARLIGITLGWFLTSSNRYLRDAATKAMVCLFQDRIPVYINVLKAFEKVNDPYVHERLYAVAYGCSLRTKEKHHLIALSEYTYQDVFKTTFVYPHILLRDYARGVIEYTLKQELNPKVNLKKVRPPYRSHFPKKFPSIKEIDKRFDPKGKDGNYDGKLWGATAILRSMTTEYGRGIAGYGDFGRYTFERALSDWKVNANSLSNYAVVRIFEMGYDPTKFTDFDRKQGSGRGHGYKERIGKKYQWLALYEVLAKVSDNCKLFDESSWSRRRKVVSYDGSWYPYVRDIDPSMVIWKTKELDDIEGSKKCWWMPEKYEGWSNNLREWMLCENDLPKPEKYLLVNDEAGKEWLNLHSYPAWKQPKRRSETTSDRMYERIFYHSGSWIIGNSDFKKIKAAFSEYNKVPSPDLTNRYEVFSREYFWSSAWQFFQRYYYGGNKTYEMKYPKTEEKYADAFYTTSYFLWEEEFDRSKEHVVRFLKPTSLLNDGLFYARQEGAFVNDNSEVICFDPCIYEEGPSALLIKKDHLMKQLAETDRCIIWVVYGEKQVIGSFRNKEAPPIEHLIHGLYYLDQNGQIKGQMNHKVKEYKRGY
jgi:hypothetical protein